ncbi:MAG TPA: biopolymer transporter ExbD [Opitutaceae bacterium]|jgi:biopolymer transport protein ExbD|nr:biopolymer transporter ExbD [Opitutaceae bacterium]MBP8962100.1 biopolymer transporter ExbD [Opitutaceae bacterium]HOD47007.1 biopolymer transporter ExbD [Opitutaceae bacterium]HOF09762.1 biopolymer transporter ExbD [Opitutaceae bacterium]HOG92216.1 biopolymer transporter ExbD [Opitutaceae bacterium]
MAGSSSGGGGGKKKARIEIIPLIDVIFFLLATFVLFTLALNKSNGLPVKLPDAASGEKRDPANSVTITVTAEGTLAWDKDPVTLQEFLDRLQQYKLREANPKVLINGDQEAMFSQAVYAFDEVRKAGISKVYIETLVQAPGK